MSSDTIGNRTRDLPACSTVPQAAAPSRAPNRTVLSVNSPIPIIVRAEDCYTHEQYQDFE